MKQNILNPYFTTGSQAGYQTAGTIEEPCLGKFIIRWAAFGLGMWWLWSAVGSHALAWFVGLLAAFALLRKDFGS